MTKPQSGSLILVVEDDDIVLLDLEDSLTQAGYQVLSALNTDQAMRLLADHPEISTVISDVKMPGSMNGLEIAAIIRDRWPWIKIILATGDSSIREVPGGGAVLHKPVRFAELLSQARGSSAAKPLMARKACSDKQTSIPLRFGARSAAMNGVGGGSSSGS